MTAGTPLFATPGQLFVDIDSVCPIALRTDGHIRNTVIGTTRAVAAVTNCRRGKIVPIGELGEICRVVADVAAYTQHAAFRGGAYVAQMRFLCPMA